MQHRVWFFLPVKSQVNGTAFRAVLSKEASLRQPAGVPLTQTRSGHWGYGHQPCKNISTPTSKGLCLCGQVSLNLCRAVCLSVSRSHPHSAKAWLRRHTLYAVLLVPLFSSRISQTLKGTPLMRTQTMSFNLIKCQHSTQTLSFDRLKDFSYVNKELRWKIHSRKIFRGAGLRKQNNSK